MHYHLEVLVPPTDDVEASVRQVLAPFDEGRDEMTGFSRRLTVTLEGGNGR
jgi:hypothetical protein